MDVIVIGSGAAGIAAARAAREAGATVAMVTRGAGASALSSGVILGTEREPWDAWAEAQSLRLGGRYVTVGGWVLPGAAALASLLDLASLPEGGMLGVVSLATHPSWSARLVAGTLGARILTVRDGPEGETFAKVASDLDTDGLAEGLALGLKSEARGLSGVLFPPVLGLKKLDVARRMSAILGVPVGEAAGGPGDPPSIRLERVIRAWLPRDAQVLRADARVELGESPRVKLSTGQELRPRAVVLATGGLTGGGLVFRDTLRESTADLPVWTRSWERVGALSGSARGADPVAWFDEARGRALGAGVRTDAAGRVKDARGDGLAAPWLWAAGEVVQSTRPPTLSSALVTGARVGREAARHALGG